MPAPLARAGLVAGLLVLLVTLIAPSPAGLPEEAWRTAGLALMMAIWWSTGPVPLGVTGLLPIVLLPLMSVASIDDVAAKYGNPLVFLFLGGFMLGSAVQRWGLHQRIAFAAVRFAGTGSRALVLGFMVASASLSMAISNTAAVVLMLPVAVSVIAAFDAANKGDEGKRFAAALLLGLAYGASIGGVGTLIGSPPNALMAGYLKTQGSEMSFARWSLIAMPFVVLFIPTAWLVLTRLVFPLGHNRHDTTDGGQLLAVLRPPKAWSTAEIRVALVFSAMVALWVLRPWLNSWPPLSTLTDPAIATAGAIVLFVIPDGTKSEARQGALLGRHDIQDLPWQILLMFGGGLALAAAIDSSGLAAWIGGSLAVGRDLPQMAFVGIVAAAVVALTELASNTATTAALLPVLAAAAESSGYNVAAVTTAIAMAASCAFMLPVATPPNAIVFASGHLTVGDMVRAGVVLNLLSVLLIVLTVEGLAVFFGAL
jgi:sodium-dependent dicarboxylate transporter 2/3/5